MSVDIASLGLEVRSDGVVIASKRLNDMEKQAGKTERATTSLADKAQRASRTMQSLGRALTIGVTLPMTAAAVAAVKLAIDAEETANKFNVVFRGSVEKSRAELEKLTATIPLTRSQMEGLAAGIQDMLVPMGVARSQAAGMSVDMVRLAGDLASFNNVPTTRVLEAMQSALAGSSEPMRRYGVDTRVTRLEQIALRDGLIKAGDEMNNAAMAAATMTAIMEDSTDAIGDAERTVDSAANQFRFLRRDVQQIAEDIGNDLLPVARDLLAMLRGLTDSVAQMEPETRKLVIQVAAMTAAAGPLLIVLGSVLGNIARISIAMKGMGAASAGAIGLAGKGGLIGLAAAAGWYIGTKINDYLDGTARSLRGVSRELIDVASDWTQFSNEVGRAQEQILLIQRAEVEEKIQRWAEALVVAGGNSRAAQAEIQRLQARYAELDIAIERNQRLMESHSQKISDAQGGYGILGDVVRNAFDAISSFQLTDTGADEAAEELAAFLRVIEDIEAQLSGPAAVAMLEFHRSVAEANALYAEGTITLSQYARAIDAFGARLGAATRPESVSTFDGFFDFDAIFDQIDDIKKEMMEVAQIEWNFENLIDSFDPLSQAMRRLGDDINLINARIEAGSMSQMEGMFMKTGVAANAAFDAIMSGMDRSSKEYKQMEVAQQALNVALGIAAIVQQGMGDPYTAIPRMAAMAAMVASLVDGISGLSGGGGAARQQAIQGTGSVLGDSEAKSESISNSIEITASATEKLVGINRAQLQALQAMSNAITGATTSIARGGIGDVNLPSIGDMSTKGALGIKFDPVADFLDGLFGFNKTKVKDQGIELFGGTLADIIRQGIGETFVRVKKKGLFGSKNKTAFGDLSDEVAGQIELLLTSMIDAVSAGAEALGISQNEIQQALDSYQVEAQRISLMDLSPEEQQAELEAVFSSIFDGLALAVVPFLGQFQKVGEGLGETLVRVATSVQVAQEAVHRLGLSIADDLGPERMAQVSVGLIEAAGGIENFISQMENFISKFAPEAHQFAIAQSDITRALEQMNVKLPESRDGFWDLLQAMDPMTEAGQQQIATLLGLADAADLYYSALEEIQQEREGLELRLLELQGNTAALRALELEALDESNRALQERIWALEEQMEAEQRLAEIMGDVEASIIDNLSPAVASFHNLMTRWRELHAEAEALGATEDQLLMVRRAARLELARWIGEMQLSTLQLAEDFFSVEQTFSQVGSSVVSTIDNMRDVALRALASIDDWLMSSQLDSNSPLPPAEQLATAESQFMEAFAAATDPNNPDFEALASLPALADAFLGQAGSFYGTSTDQYNAIWQMVQDLMNQAADIDPPPEQLPPNAGQIDTLIQTNSAFAPAIAALQQELAAAQLADQINALAIAQASTPFEIAQELGFTTQNMRTLLEALGHEIPHGTEDQLRAHFDEIVGGLSAQNPLAESIHDSIEWSTIVMEAHFWFIGTLLAEIRDAIEGIPTMHTGGMVMNNGLHNLQAGEMVIPRGQVASSSGAHDFAEVRTELNRISNLLERGNSDRRDGLGAVVREEHSTKRAIERKQSIVRAV